MHAYNRAWLADDMLYGVHSARERVVIVCVSDSDAVVIWLKMC